MRIEPCGHAGNLCVTQSNKTSHVIGITWTKDGWIVLGVNCGDLINAKIYAKNKMAEYLKEHNK